MAEPVVLREDRDGVRTLTLNRPQVRNAIDLAMLEALHAELEAAARGPGVRCVVVTGAGSAFCAGGDVQQMLERRGKAVETMERLRWGLAGLAERLRSLDQPVVAKVNGDCVGAGLGLALACDLSVAAATARFGAPFLNVGLVPDTALSRELPIRMGLARAKEFVFTAQLIPAPEAWELGLINKFVPLADLDNEVAALAARLAAMPLRTLGEAKRLLQRGAELAHSDAMLLEAYAQGIAFTTPEHAEGVDAFLGKRKPEFRQLG